MKDQFAKQESDPLLESQEQPHNNNNNESNTPKQARTPDTVEKDKNSGLRAAGAVAAGVVVVGTGVVTAAVIGPVAMIAAGTVLTLGALAWSKKETTGYQERSNTRLCITLYGATNLHGEEKMDPYVRLRIGNAKMQSQPKHNTTSPEWNEGFEVGVLLDKHKMLQLDVHDHGKTFRNLLGHAELDISTLTSDPKPHELTLRGGSGIIKLTAWITKREPTEHVTPVKK